MMLGGQSVVIDDEPEHLIGLADTLNGRGMPCQQILFRGDIERVDACPEVRLIFADLHLGTGAIGSDHSTDFSTVGSLLEAAIRPNGPYGIVLWTMYPDQANRLDEFLKERLTEVRKPVGVRPLAKASHLDATGRVRNEAKLFEEAEKAVAGFEALLEKPDATAMRQTLARLFGKPEGSALALVGPGLPSLDVGLDNWMVEDAPSLGMTPKAMLDSGDPGKLFLLERIMHSIATSRAASHPKVVRDVVRRRIETMYYDGVPLDAVDGPESGNQRTRSAFENWMDTEGVLHGGGTPRQFFDAEDVDVRRLQQISSLLDAVDEGAFA